MFAPWLRVALTDRAARGAFPRDAELHDEPGNLDRIRCPGRTRVTATQPLRPLLYPTQELIRSTDEMLHSRSKLIASLAGGQAGPLHGEHRYRRRTFVKATDIECGLGFLPIISKLCTRSCNRRGAFRARPKVSCRKMTLRATRSPIPQPRGS